VILYQWRGSHRNFGDELNSLLWPRLLPDFFDQDETTRFLGIGSILDDRHAARTVKLVAGSGYGGYRPQIVLDETWIVHWVRGRRTARLLGLPSDLGIGDPASLVPLVGLAPPREDRDIGLIPHFESAIRGAWQEVADRAGATLIDPRNDPLTVIAAIGKCRLVMSEALHGIIVADALRVPWIAIRPLAPIHRPKWFDWAETLLGRNPRPDHRIPRHACFYRTGTGAPDPFVAIPSGPAGLAPSGGAVARDRWAAPHRSGNPGTTRHKPGGAAIVPRRAIGGSPVPDDGGNRCTPKAPDARLAGQRRNRRACAPQRAPEHPVGHPLGHLLGRAPRPVGILAWQRRLRLPGCARPADRLNPRRPHCRGEDRN
jgi:hypothetical protein